MQAKRMQGLSEPFVERDASEILCQVAEAVATVDAEDIFQVLVLGAARAMDVDLALIGILEDGGGGPGPQHRRLRPWPDTAELLVQLGGHALRERRGPAFSLSRRGDPGAVSRPARQGGGRRGLCGDPAVRLPRRVHGPHGPDRPQAAARPRADGKRAQDLLGTGGHRAGAAHGRRGPPLLGAELQEHLRGGRGLPVRARR